MRNSSPDPLALLRELDPEKDAPARAGQVDDDAAVARIVATGPPRPRRTATPSRLPISRGAAVAAAAAAAVVVTVAMSLAPAGEDAHGIVADAYAALSADDDVVHYRTVSTLSGAEGRRRSAEVWLADGGAKVRFVLDGGEHEYVLDTEAKYSASYVRDRDELVEHTDPEIFESVGRGQAFGGPLGVDTAGQLPNLLARARDGDARVALLDDAVVRGADVHRVRLNVPALAAAPRPGDGKIGSAQEATPEVAVVLAIDKQTLLPIRLDRFGPDGRLAARTEFYDAERIAKTPAALKELKMSEHPGARRVVRDRA